MATASTTEPAKDFTAGEVAPRSAFGRLWAAWQRKRKRNRKRNLSQVRFRLTREGVHFIGILSFIFIGAVIRDINLMILLAGSMIGLLLLQWRFNKSTLAGLRFQRRLPRNTTQGMDTEVETVVFNPKSWLGAWLVLLEDRITKVAPQKVRIRSQGTVLLDAVKPQGRTEGRYRLVFRERGRYEVGPTSMTTRFPMGLGRGWRTLENASQIIVHPQSGQLLPAVRTLFDQDQIGNAASKSSSGTQEGDFFGIRPWATGDSRRWIHWRTTARLGELSVRQFEQHMQQNACLILDLWRNEDGTNQEDCERAIAFAATMARRSVSQNRDRLAVGVAGASEFVCPAIQSRTLVDNLLDHLAVAEPSDQPELADVFGQLAPVLLKNPNAIIVSTRAESLDWTKDELTAQSQRLLSNIRWRWLDVSQGDLEPYFEWEPVEDGS